jgi:hypothetical protein
MTVQQAVNLTILKATGKATILDPTTAKYQKVLALLNNYTDEWADEAGTDWQSLRQVFTLGTIAATDTYDLDSTINEVSSQEGDYVRVTHVGGTQQSLYTIVPPQRLYDAGTTLNNYGAQELYANGTCAVVGNQIIFSRPFLISDPQYGGTITVAGYIETNTLTKQNDLIQVDIPRWLCVRSAAEYIRTDVTRQQQVPNLISEANEIMKQMKDLNETQSEYVFRGSWRPAGDTFGNNPWNS